MTQNDLNRAVAQVTGETVTEIAHRGFQPLWMETNERSPADEECLPDSPHPTRIPLPEPAAA